MNCGLDCWVGVVDCVGLVYWLGLLGYVSFGLGWWFCGLLCGGVGFGVMMISRCVV